ncbi:paralemmin-3 [Clupea harengus]|uniref:Paralemmin-3 n=1 Tax=Clupea harengus TaxID=7950 RepID=A0A6P8F4J1_CLUHA|nr:paralemmin-3 [Clupea harengus]
MDEAEKYQQRLQAIAEKRRLQEEQERVKREMEEERVRLQQQKRKSLRDQWLMEGPPLSPDSSGPRSPLWGPQAQEMEQNLDSLQAKAERLTEEVGKLAEDGVSVVSVNDGLTQGNSEGVHILEDAGTDSTLKETVLQNGQGNGTMEVGAEDDVKATSVSPVMAEDKGPNGEVATDVPALEADAAQPSTEEQGQIQSTPEETVTMATSASLSESAAKGVVGEAVPTSNGPATKAGDGPGGGDGAVTMTFLGFSDAGKSEGEGLDDDDDGGAIMRAERVIITDEGEEVEEDPEGQTEASGAPVAEAPTDPENQEAGATEAEPQAPTEAEKDTEAEVTERKTDATEEEKSGEGGETPSEAQAAPQAAEATATEVQPQPEPREGAVVTSEVPVYSPAAPATPNATAEDESQQPETNELKEEEEGLEAPATAPAPSSTPETVPSSPSQFQDVPLDEAADSPAKPPRSEPQAEQEPLLAPKTAPQTDTSAPRRGGEGGDAPKRKTCQCCSVM